MITSVRKVSPTFMPTVECPCQLCAISVQCDVIFVWYDVVAVKYDVIAF